MINLGDKILKQIEQQDLEPKSKGSFRWQEAKVWLALLAVVLLMAAASALLWYFSGDLDWEWSCWSGRCWWLGPEPLAFMLIILGALVGTFLLFRHTKKGYRYNWLMITAGLSSAALGLAAVIGFWGWSKHLDNMLAYAPFYRPHNMYIVRAWERPDDGRLMGRVTKTGTTTLELVDNQNKVWLVDFSQVLNAQFKPTIGMMVKMRGQVQAEDYFKAFNIGSLNPEICPITGRPIAPPQPKVPGACLHAK
jgi:hypothetical protein